MVINNDPLIYRWKRTLEHAFGSDANSANAITVYKIRPRWSSAILNAVSVIFIVATIAMAVFK